MATRHPRTSRYAAIAWLATLAIGGSAGLGYLVYTSDIARAAVFVLLAAGVLLATITALVSATQWAVKVLFPSSGGDV